MGEKCRATNISIPGMIDNPVQTPQNCITFQKEGLDTIDL